MTKLEKSGMVAKSLASRSESRLRASCIAALCLILLVAVRPLDAVQVTSAEPEPCAKRIQGETASLVFAGLEAGRMVIVMRHAQAIDDKDIALDKPGTCKENTRYVNSKGKKQLDDILPVLQALSSLKFKARFSPMCRTEQTAKYLFGSSNATVDDRLELGAPEITLQTFLLCKASSENLVLVTHRENVAKLTGLVSAGILEAMAVVFDTVEAPSPTLGKCWGHLLPEDWAVVAASERAAR